MSEWANLDWFARNQSKESHFFIRWKKKYSVHYKYSFGAVVALMNKIVFIFLFSSINQHNFLIIQFTHKKHWSLSIRCVCKTIFLSALHFRWLFQTTNESHSESTNHMENSRHALNFSVNGKHQKLFSDPLFRHLLRKQKRRMKVGETRHKASAILK